MASSVRLQLLSDLFGDLSEVVDEANGGSLLERIIDVVDVNLTLVKQVVEDVDCLHSWRTLLLVAENEVDPFMEVGRHVVALQCLHAAAWEDKTEVNVYSSKRRNNFVISGFSSYLSVDSDELPGVALGPRW